MVTLENKGPLCLAIMRIMLGWMMIWAFLDKMFGLGFPSPPEVAVINGGSPTEYYLTELVSGPFAEIWHALAGNAVIDAMLMFGLIAVGLGLTLGMASKLSTIGMTAMMIMMFVLEMPPADNPLIDYHIIYVMATLSVYWLGGFDTLSLNDRWKSLGIVQRIGILQ